MTTLYMKELTCAVCGSASTTTRVASTNGFGSPDLDTRPPEMERSTLSYRIERCPECGYCAPDISASLEGSSAVLQSPEYQARLADSEFPDKSNEFLAAALIAKAHGRFDEAAWGAIHAAWHCDDSGSAGAANQCRLLAASLIGEARASGQALGEQAGATEVMETDLLRRAGRFPEALAAIKAGMGLDPEDVIQQILLFEKSLIQRGDTACHTIAEALGEDDT